MKVKARSQALVKRTRGIPGKVKAKRTARHLSRERIAQLHMERECTASSGDSCWLCDCLGQWNAVLKPLRIALREREPGRITAFIGERKGPAPLKELATFFTAWLQQKHCCVDRITFRDNNGDAIPDSFAGSPSSARHVKICGRRFSDWRLDIDLLGPVGQVESLVLSLVTIDSDTGMKLARLLEANASSVRTVKFTDVCATTVISDVLVRALSKCKGVKDLEYSVNLSWSVLTDFTNLLRNAESLQSLTLVTPLTALGSTPTDIVAFRGPILAAAVIDLIKRSTTLEELVYQGNDDEFEGILEALGANSTIRVLVLKGHVKEYYTYWVGISPGTATVLKSVLLRNKRLESLTFENCFFNYLCGVQIHFGLLRNETLKCLDTSDCMLTYLTAGMLCSAMEVNKTVSLKIGRFSGRHLARYMPDLAELLARLDCYDRVQMCWSSCDAPGLAASLLRASSCPRELQLSTRQFTEASLDSLCQALSSSCRVVSLTVELAVLSFGQLECLSRMLVANTSLRNVALRERSLIMGDAIYIAHGLSSNKFVTRLSLDCIGVGVKGAELLASLLEKNEALNEVFLSSKCTLGWRSMKKLSQAVVRNRFLTNFTIDAGPNNDGSMAALHRAVERNRLALHRAAHFALGRNTGKLCAEGFELFAEKESLIACIVSTSELTEADAVAAVERAKRFILYNYLVINEIYRCKLECNPGEGTQIDQLTFECWLAIVKYLKVSDIVGM